MATVHDQPLSGARVLVVEDEYFIADDLARALRSCGATPVGPVASVEQARELLKAQPVDAAILDLNLRGSMAFPLAEQLAKEQMPCVIISGYGEDSVPDGLKGLARLEKPVSASVAMSCLAEQIGRGPDGTGNRR